MYIGNKVGMEFISEGPKSYEINMGECGNVQFRS